MYMLGEVRPEVASQDVAVVLPERGASHDRPSSRSMRRCVLLRRRWGVNPFCLVHLRLALLLLGNDVLRCGPQKRKPGFAIGVGQRLSI